MKTIVYAVAALAALCASAWADGPKTWIGNDMFRYCKMAALLASEGRGIASAQDAGSAGGCQGFFVGLWFIVGQLSPDARFCPPPGATAVQGLQIVVTYVEKDPTLLNQDIRQIAVDHLRRVWPCR